MGLFKGVFKKSPNSLLIAFFANQLAPIIISKKSSNRNVIPLPREEPAVSPKFISGLRSIENIKIYRPHSMFMKETKKIARAMAPQIRNIGGYCEIRNPASRAITIKKISRRGVRTVFF